MLRGNYDRLLGLVYRQIGQWAAMEEGLNEECDGHKSYESGTFGSQKQNTALLYKAPRDLNTLPKYVTQPRRDNEHKGKKSDG